ncbi:MAG: glycosyltransferase family 4 protein [Pseudomonadota bacterium]
MNVINLSDLSTSWNWLRDEFKHTDDEWHHYSSLAVNLPSFLPKKDSIARVIAASQAVKLARKKPSVLVSHGPRPSFYAGKLAKTISPDTPHLAYSFNLTDLPKGIQHRLMIKAFQQPTKFVTYSSVERKLYADYFDIPIEKIDMLHWAVHAPKVDLTELPIEAGRYICALGSQGRDYATLLSAMKKLPNIKLVIVASPDSILGLTIPDNVKIHTNIPLAHAHNILAHSAFMALPLRDSQVPCGHVTIVSGMFFNKAMVVTNSLGVQDYIEDDKTGLFFESKNVDDLSKKIEALWNDESKANQLSQAGFAFANQYCTQKTAVDYFTGFLEQHAKT